MSRFCANRGYTHGFLGFRLLSKRKLLCLFRRQWDWDYDAFEVSLLITWYIFRWNVWKSESLTPSQDTPGHKLCRLFAPLLTPFQNVFVNLVFRLCWVWLRKRWTTWWCVSEVQSSMASPASFNYTTLIVISLHLIQDQIYPMHPDILTCNTEYGFLLNYDACLFVQSMPIGNESWWQFSPYRSVTWGDG